MNHWPFIWAAYGLTGLVTGGALLWSFTAMRRAEQKARDL
jgi:heme exporter protein CcmD